MNGTGEDQETTGNQGFWLILAALAVSLVYLVWAGWHYHLGESGVLRGAVLFFGASVFSLGILVERRWVAKLLKRGVLIVFALGVLDMVLHSPGSSLIGLPTRYDDDFHINLTAAKNLYQDDGDLYGIQKEFDLPNASISFPFPTYAIYWACSGLGQLSLALSGAIFTILNLLAAWVLIRNSFRLTGKNDEVLDLYGFLVLASPLWGAILIGQTSVMASALIVAGWYQCQSKNRLAMVVGAGLVALGLMIKPNFLPLLAIFLFRWLRHPRTIRWLILFIGVPLAVILYGACVVRIPGGVGFDHLQSFKEIALPGALSKVEVPNNLSLVGFLHNLLPLPFEPTRTGLVLGVLLIVVGGIKRWNWRYWLLVPLLISPITWQPYLALALPVQLALAGPTDRFERTLLILATGLIALDFTGISTFGILILLWLVARTSHTEVPGKN